MTTQPEALRLADALDAGWCPVKSPSEMKQAATWLRYLHSILSRAHDLSRIRAKRITELNEVNQELLEALKYHQEQTRPIERTCAAIAKAEGQE